MTTFNDQRPREKMHQKGVAALTNGELLQVMIGSGIAGVPVTKIARKVDKIFRVTRTMVTIDELAAIPGVGMVKAGQIIASLEFANRRIYQTEAEEGEPTDILKDVYTDLRNSKQPMLLYVLFDGNERLIEEYSAPLNIHDDPVRIVRKLFAQALAQSTTSVRIAIGYELQSLEPGLFELNLARDAYSMAALLSIPIKSFLLLNASGEYTLKENPHG